MADHKPVSKKKCARCEKVRPAKFFGKNKRMASGLKSYCVDCTRDVQREWNDRARKGLTGTRKKTSVKKTKTKTSTKETSVDPKADRLAKRRERDRKARATKKLLA